MPSTRERIIAAMAHYLGEGYPEAEIITLAIEDLNENPIDQIFYDSLDIDHRHGLTPAGKVSTPEHFGRCIASQYLAIDDPLWWDDHHDFELHIPYIKGLQEAV